MGRGDSQTTEVELPAQTPYNEIPIAPRRGSETAEQLNAREALHRIGQARQRRLARPSARYSHDPLIEQRSINLYGRKLFGQEPRRYDIDAVFAEGEAANLDAGSAMELIIAARQALDAAGLPRTSQMNGGEMRGLTANNHSGSIGFAVHDRGDHLELHLVISGKNAGLEYRTWYEQQGSDDLIDLHEPTNPEKLHPQISKAIEGLGLKVRDVRNAGASLHWDDDVLYVVTTDPPA